jgi:hypothetical protein
VAVVALAWKTDARAPAAQVMLNAIAANTVLGFRRRTRRTIAGR